MGVIKRGILGGFSGAVGNIVGSSWKGIAVMKAKPLSVANPRTSGQVAQRSSFAAVVRVASLLLVSTIKPLWDRFAQRESGYNAFVSRNITVFENPLVPLWANLKTSIGTLTPILGMVVPVISVSGNTVVNWTDNSGTGNALATDILYLVMVDDASQTVVAIPTAYIRSDAGAFFPTPAGLSVTGLAYVYAAFQRADGSLVSTSEVVSATVGT